MKSMNGLIRKQDRVYTLTNIWTSKAAFTRSESLLMSMEKHYKNTTRKIRKEISPKSKMQTTTERSKKQTQLVVVASVEI